MKWNSFDIIKFLAIYEHFPILWNFKVSVPNGESKENEFTRLRDELRAAGLLGTLTDKQLKAKIKCIKDVLRQELAKIHKSLARCTDPKDLYHPKLAWFEAAEFLQNIITTSAAKYVPMELNQPPMAKVEFIAIDDNSQSDVSNPENASSRSKRTLDISPFSVTSTKMKKIKSMPPSELQNNSPNNSNEIPSCASSGISSLGPEDVYDQFGKYIASELRSLPAREAALAKQEIQNILTKVHLNLCQPNATNNFELSQAPMPIDYVSPTYSSDSE